MSDPILPLPDPDGPLSTARPAEATASLCQGERVWLRVEDRAGPVAAGTDAGPLLGALTTDAGPCGNVLVEPGRVRRELLSSEGVVLEDCFALPRLPGARFQWSTPNERALRLDIRLELPSGGESTRDGNRLTWSAAGGSSVTELRVHPAPDRLDVEATEEATVVRMTVSAPPGEPVHLTLGSADRKAVARAAADCLDRFEPHIALQSGRLQELATNHLRTRTGVADIDEGLEWAKFRAGGLDRPSLERLKAQLGVALFREAEATLNALANDSADDFGSALAEFLLWTGDHDAPARRRSALERWIAHRRERGGGDPARHTRLVEALEGLGYPDEAEAVRRLPTRVRGGAVTLPMAGSTAVTEPASHDPEEVWVRFRGLAERCAAGASPADDGADPSYALVRTLMDNVLGARAEAGLGRLELSPALPAHLTSFHVEGIRAGRGGLDFRMDRDGARYRFLFGPTSGAMPINVIFQPSVPGTGLRGAKVDGEPAELDWTIEGERTTPRLQLPVDGERTVEFEVE